jgi:hypothetical protein
MPRQVSEVVDDLITLYTEKFGGKSQGRYKISKENLAHLSARVNLQIDGFISPVRDGMLVEGYGFIRNYDEEGNESYIIIKNSVFKNYREVPLRLIRKCIKEAEATEDIL